VHLLVYYTNKARVTLHTRREEVLWRM